MKIGQQPAGNEKLSRLLIVLAGIIFFQSLLYGPSLVGQKILLPLDILTLPGWCVPQTAETESIVPQNLALADLVDEYEPARRFSASEIHQGRFPMWDPFQYAGVPCIWPRFSPFLLLSYITPSPVILAWVQLVSAVVAGLGMYVFARRLLRASFWPAAIVAWLYPMTAFFVLWVGAPVRFPVCLLPWLFVMIDVLVRRPNARSAAGLALLTGLMLVSGDIDIAGQALLGGGFYAIWCLCDAYQNEWDGRNIRKAVAFLVLGWGLGFMLAMPYMLPVFDYVHTGARMTERSQGLEERPPIGLAALPQVVLQDMYGTTAKGSCLIEPLESNLNESSSAAYAGIFATLLVAPLAWFDRSRRSLNWFWAGLVLFGLSWCLDIPGMVQVLRLPGLNMMSNNRLVFLAALAIFALAATGLENVMQGRIERRRWFCGPAAVLVALCAWCLYRGIWLPEPVATQLGDPLPRGVTRNTGELFGSIQNPEAVQAWFSLHYSIMALACGIGFAGWLWLWSQKTAPKTLLAVLAVLMSADLLWFDHGRAVQCSPDLYYPDVPALNEIGKSNLYRATGIGCLPATLCVMQGFNDVKGCDAVDPARMVELLKIARQSPDNVPYAQVQYYLPALLYLPPEGVRFPPILDMLGLRYGIFRGTAKEGLHPKIQSPDFYVLINTNALPRTFVPQSVETVADDDELFKKVGSHGFDPAEIAYIPTSPGLQFPAQCHGTATITNEIPTHIMMSVHMNTPGLVVLADRWDKGWHALWNGRPVEILQANYAIRGVALPAGAGTLEFYYRPASLVLGCYLAASAALILLVLLILPKRFNRQ